jgi:hypothetical protein
MRWLTVVLSFGYWTVIFGVLCLTYDFQPRLAAAYTELTSMVWAAGMIVWLIARVIGRGRPFVAGIAAFVALAVMLNAYGVFQFQAPREITESITPQMIESHFFSEFNGIVFSWISGPLCAVALGACVAIDTDRALLRRNSGM